MRFHNPAAVLEWPAPNFINPVVRGPYLYVINSILFLLATIAVSLRFYARLYIRRWLGPDDVLILLSWARLLLQYHKHGR
jgi:hypothetical protein